MTEIAGGLVGGRYRLVEPVGQGAMGRVWRGRDEVLGRDVAVKELLIPHGIAVGQRELMVARVLREARSAARLNHPGIIKVHDVVERDGAPLIVMEFVTGRSLGAILAEDGRLPPERVAEIGIAMAEALREAHRAGIVHRDLKPDNVLIAGRRTVITDFGIASLVGDPALTSPGAVMGTPSFMSPEQVEGAAVSPACDLWSLGATLYAAVEGTPPFTGPTFAVLFNAILSKDPRPCEHAGPLAPVLTALLAKTPGLRPNADRAAHALTVLDGAPVAKKRRTVLWAGLGAVAAAAVPAGLLLGRGSPPAGRGSPPAGPAEPAVFPATLTGHTEGVLSVSFGPNGRTLASCGGDKTIRLWDVASGTNKATLPGDATAVWFSPDGKTLAAANSTATVMLWDVASGRRTDLKGHNGVVTAVAFSPDGRTLASSSSSDTTIRLWNVADHSTVGILHDHTGPVDTVAFSRNGRALASSSRDATIRLWDVAKQTVTDIVPSITPGSLATFSSDLGTLAVTSARVEFWQVEGKDAGTKVELSEDLQPYSMTFSPDGRTLITGSLDEVEFWELVGHTRTTTIPCNTSAVPVDSVAVSPSGKILAGACKDHLIRLWKVPQ